MFALRYFVSRYDVLGVALGLANPSRNTRRGRVRYWVLIVIGLRMGRVHLHMRGVRGSPRRAPLGPPERLPLGRQLVPFCCGARALGSVEVVQGERRSLGCSDVHQCGRIWSPNRAALGPRERLPLG